MVAIIVASTLLTSGCAISPINSIDSKEKEVSDYNKMVEETFSSATNVRYFAESEKSNMLDFVLRNKDWEYFTGDFKHLSKEELESFSLEGVVHDKYFTSLGADSLREVLVINGKKHRMFVTIIWGIEKVYSVDREVIDL